MTDLMENNVGQQSHYSKLSEASTNGGPSWVSELRRARFEQFDELGFPTNRPGRLAAHECSGDRENELRPRRIGAAPMSRGEFSFGSDAACELVFVNGHFRRSSRARQSAEGVRFDLSRMSLKTDAGELKPALGHQAKLEEQPVRRAQHRLPPRRRLHPLHEQHDDRRPDPPAVYLDRIVRADGIASAVLVVAEDNVEAHDRRDLRGRQPASISRTRSRRSSLGDGLPDRSLQAPAGIAGKPITWRRCRWRWASGTTFVSHAASSAPSSRATT